MLLKTSLSLMLLASFGLAETKTFTDKMIYQGIAVDDEGDGSEYISFGTLDGMTSYPFDGNAKAIQKKFKLKPSQKYIITYVEECKAPFKYNEGSSELSRHGYCKSGTTRTILKANK